MALRNRLLRFAQEIEKAWIGAKFGQVRIDAYEGETNRMFALSLGQPAKRVVEIVEPRVDDRDLVSGDPVLSALRDDVFENRTGFVTFADGGEHVRALRVRGRRVAGETAFLFERRKRFRVFAFQFISPTQNRVRRDRARILFERLLTLHDRFVKL